MVRETRDESQISDDDDDDDDDESHSGYARRPYEPSLVAAYHYNKQHLSTHDPKDQPTPHSTLMSEERDSLPVW